MSKQADTFLAVSEKRKVGSTRVDKDSLVDLMGDENPSTNGAPTPTSALDNLGSAQNTQDLLADIFGSSSSDLPPSTQPLSQPKPQNAVNDIMSLFGNTSISPDPTGPAAASAAPSPLDMLSTMASSASPQLPAAANTPPVASQPAPKQQLQAYTAYEKNGLKITLTPKINPAQQGMVQILAKFTALDQTGVKNVNFQAAVPKVRRSIESLESDVLTGSFLRLNNYRCSLCLTAMLHPVQRKHSKCESSLHQELKFD